MMADVWVEIEFKLAKTNSIQVSLYDSATDGCLTNLRETREYAEEKLRAKGASIASEVRTRPHDYEFKIEVISYRLAQTCTGSIKIELRKMGLHENKAGDEVFHFSYVAEANLVFQVVQKLTIQCLIKSKSLQIH